MISMMLKTTSKNISVEGVKNTGAKFKTLSPKPIAVMMLQLISEIITIHWLVSSMA
jgi:hypothetical protein